MRSIETLVREYPNKTGKEILEIQEKDKLLDEQELQKYNEKSLALIAEYNEKGGCFKSTFGLDQYRYDRFFNLYLDERGNIICDVETIVGFYKGHTTPNNEILLERKYKENQRFDKYLPQEEERISKEEYNLLSEHLDNVFTSFWGLIDQSKFN